MKTLIVHIEYDEEDVGADYLTELMSLVDAALDREASWRYFDSLDDALEWEASEYPHRREVPYFQRFTGIDGA